MVERNAFLNRLPSYRLIHQRTKKLLFELYVLCVLIKGRRFCLMNREPAYPLGFKKVDSMITGSKSDNIYIGRFCVTDLGLMKAEHAGTDVSDRTHSLDLPVIRIGDVAKELGLSTSTLRLYEYLGLVLPYKEGSGQRLYSLADVQWLRKLNDYFAETRTGPTALARLLRLIPTHAMRQRRFGYTCNVKAKGKICWQMHPKLRRHCRECPAYLEKDAVLDFEKNFKVILLESKAS